MWFLTVFEDLSFIDVKCSLNSEFARENTQKRAFISLVALQLKFISVYVFFEIMKMDGNF